VAWLGSWLIVCLVSQLDQLIGRSFGWWVSSSDGRSICQAVFRSVGLKVSCSVGRLLGQFFRSVSRSPGRLVGRLVVLLLVVGWVDN
jgi:hypothetical protein